MKRAALLLALALFASPAWAGGFAELYGTWVDFDKQRDDAPGFGVRVGWNFTDALAVEAGVTLLDSIRLHPDEFISGEIQLTPVDLGLRYGFDFGLYLAGGVSYVFLDTSNLSTDEESGWYGRVGYEQIGPTGWGWFVEGLYREVDTSIFGADVDLSGAGAAVGGKVKW